MLTHSPSPVRPSYKSGYARSAESAYPEFWDGLVGAWVPALGASGLTIPDLSGRGNHGTLGDMDGSEWRSSKIGAPVIHVDGGDSDEISFGKPEDGAGITTGFSVSLYLIGNTNRNLQIGRNGFTGNRGWQIETSFWDFSAQTIGFSCASNATTIVQQLSASRSANSFVSNNLGTNKWMLWTCVFDGTQQRMWVYLNGRDVTATPVTAPSSLYLPSTTCGYGWFNNAGNNNTDTDLAFMTMHNRALSPSEIARHWRDPLAPFRKRRKLIFSTQAAAGPTYTLTADSGSFTLTGNATGLVAGRKLTAAAGSYALTGNAVSLVYSPIVGPDYTLVASAGSYTLTGNAIGLIAGRSITAAAGSYTLTGNATALAAGRTLSLAAGSFTLTGNATGLVVSRAVTLSTGVYTLTGNAVAFTYSNAPTATLVTLSGITLTVPKAVATIRAPRASVTLTTP